MFSSFLFMFIYTYWQSVLRCEGADFSGALVCMWLWEYLMTSEVLQELPLLHSSQERVGGFPKPPERETFLEPPGVSSSAPELMRNEQGVPRTPSRDRPWGPQHQDFSQQRPHVGLGSSAHGVTRKHTADSGPHQNVGVFRSGHLQEQWMEAAATRIDLDFSKKGPRFNTESLPVGNGN